MTKIEPNLSEKKHEMTALAKELVAAASGSQGVQLIKSSPPPTRENELLFFFKPEVFLPGAHTAKLVETGLDLLTSFDIEISASIVIPGPELERLTIMDTHYGYINTLSRRASLELDASQLAAVRKGVGADAKTPVLGGHEVLARFPEYTADSLNQLWSTKPSVKLRSGLYLQQYEFAGSPIVVVNGFHPEQLAYFTAPDRKIGLFVLHTNLPWRFLRQRVLGDTFPERALPGTLRRHYFDQAGDYGLSNVSIANNCAHLSAGPFEAGFELQNFLGRVGKGKYDAGKTNLGQRLKASELQFALTNPVTALNTKDVSLFDATEEMDTTGAVEILRTQYAGSAAATTG